MKLPGWIAKFMISAIVSGYWV